MGKKAAKDAASGLDLKSPKKKLSRAARRGELSSDSEADDLDDLDSRSTGTASILSPSFSRGGHASSASLYELGGGDDDDDDDDDDDYEDENDARTEKERAAISAGVGGLTERRGKTRTDSLVALREALRNFHPSHAAAVDAHSEELLDGAMACLRRGGGEGALAAELLGALFVSLGGDRSAFGREVWRRAGGKLRLIAGRAAAEGTADGGGGGGGGGSGSGSSKSGGGGSGSGGGGGGKRGKRRAATSKSSKGGGGGGGDGDGGEDGAGGAAAAAAAAALGAFAMGCLVCAEDRPDDVEDALAFAATLAAGDQIPTAANGNKADGKPKQPEVAESVRVAALQAWGLVSTMVSAGKRRKLGSERLLPALVAILSGVAWDVTATAQPTAASESSFYTPEDGEGNDDENADGEEDDDGEDESGGGNGSSSSGGGGSGGGAMVRAGFDLKFQAGFVVALIAEARAEERAELEEEGEEYEATPGEEELWAALRAALHHLANESSKRLSKAAKKEQHAAFRHFLKATDASLAAFADAASASDDHKLDLRYFDDGSGGDRDGDPIDARLGSTIRFRGGKVACSSWVDLARLCALRGCLKGGVTTHLAGNRHLCRALLEGAWENFDDDQRDALDWEDERERRSKGSAASRKATQGRTKLRNAKRSAKDSFFHDD